MKFPVLFLNFKTYLEATGKNALKLALIAENASKQTGIPIVLVVQAIDIRLIAEHVSLPVFAQHIDPIMPGANTGSILPEAVILAGAKGSVINHAENKRDNSFIEKVIKIAHKTKLEVMVCAETTERARQIASFHEKPEFISVEPPELIGSNISVSTAKPEIITDSIKAVHSITFIPVIAGAGIKNASDIKKALALGANGVFVSSGIVKARDQEKALLELLSAFD